MCKGVATCTLCICGSTWLRTRGILIVWNKGGFNFFPVHLSFTPSLSFASFFSPSFLPWNNKIVWPLSYGELLKWLEEPVNLVGTFGSRFSGAVAVPIFHVFMCSCLCVCVCVCLCVCLKVYACSHESRLPAFLCVTQMCLDLVCALEYMCVCMCSCGSLFHSHADL